MYPSEKNENLHWFSYLRMNPWRGTKGRFRRNWSGDAAFTQPLKLTRPNIEPCWAPQKSTLKHVSHPTLCAGFHCFPGVRGGGMLDTQEQWWHEVEEEQWQGCFHWKGLGFSHLVFFCWFGFFRMVSAGSLTRRCGRGESAVRGRAVGFRVGHGEGHWAGHWGRWRQQEGAWHFALAAPVWLQTTQIGSGGRHASIRRHGMKKRGRSSEGQVQKNIHDGGGVGNGERKEGVVGNNNQSNDVCGRHLLWRCEKIIITTGFDRSGNWSLRWEVPQRWSVVGGGEWANYLTGFVQKMARNQNHGRLLCYTSTTSPSIPALNSKLKSQRLEMKTETRWHNTGRVCLTEVCCDWFTLVLMVAISQGLGGA